MGAGARRRGRGIMIDDDDGYSVGVRVNLRTGDVEESQSGLAEISASNAE